MKLFFLGLSVFLSIPAFAKPAPPLVSRVSQARFEVSRRAAEKEDALAQLSTFSALPSFSSGLFSGIKVSSFKKGCLLPRFGIQEGDVVEMVNGQPIRSPADVVEIGKKLANAKPGAKVRIHLTREDRELVLTYLLVR